MTVNSVRRDLPSWCGWIAVIAAVATLTYVQWRSVGPVYRADEVGNLGNALIFVNPDTSWVLIGKAYMPGLGILLAPLWMLWDDPATVYRVAVALSAALGALAIVPLRAIARHVGAAPVVSTVLASLVVIAPSRALTSNYVWAENLLVLTVAWTVVLLLRVGSKTTTGQALILGLAAGLTFLAHGRALPFALLALVAAVWLLRSNVRAAVAAGVAGLATIGASYALFSVASSALYTEHDRAGSILSDLARLTVPTYLTTMGSQVWYQIGAWAGVTVIGGIALVGRAKRKGVRSPEAAVVALLGAMALVLPALVANVDVHGRGHVYFYGRYLDAFLVPLAVIGLAALLRGVGRRVLAATAALAVVSAASFAWLSAPNIGADFQITPGHVAGVAYLIRVVPADTGWAGDWTVVAFLAIVPALVVLALARWRWAAVAFFGAWALAVTVYADAAKFDKFDQEFRVPPVQVQVLEGIHRDVALYGDVSVTHVAVNWNDYTFWSTPRAFSVLREGTDMSRMHLFVSSFDSPYIAQTGAAPFVGSVVGGTATWVVQGDLQDALERDGRLMQRRAQ